MNIKKGDIVLVNLNGSNGSVQSGIRPCVVVQNNIGNIHSPTTVVVPMTSKVDKRNIPTHVFISKQIGLTHNSIALCEQIITINKTDIIKIITELDEQHLSKVEDALCIQMNLNNNFESIIDKILKKIQCSNTIKNKVSLCNLVRML